MSEAKRNASNIHDAEIYDDDSLKSTLNSNSNFIVLSKDKNVTVSCDTVDDFEDFSKGDDDISDVVYRSYVQLMKSIDDNSLELLEKCDFEKFKKFIGRYKVI